MNLYFKRVWDETTGEALTNHWGTSAYYFETDEDLNVFRQIQVFENGQVLKYDTDLLDDEFGGLSDQQLEADEFREFSIPEDEFSDAWSKLERTLK